MRFYIDCTYSAQLRTWWTLETIFRNSSTFCNVFRAKYNPNDSYLVPMTSDVMPQLPTVVARLFSRVMANHYIKRRNSTCAVCFTTSYSSSGVVCFFIKDEKNMTQLLWYPTGQCFRNLRLYNNAGFLKIELTSLQPAEKVCRQFHGFLLVRQILSPSELILR